MGTSRIVFIPCSCGKIHRIKDPGRNRRLRCKTNDAPLVYECALGDSYRLRGERRDVILETEEITIGRKGTSGIVIGDKTLSREHCRLLGTPRGYEVEDLDSSNGTFVNESRLEPHKRLLLQGGDLLRLSKTRFRYIVPEPSQVATEIGPPPAVEGSDTSSLEAVESEEAPAISDELVGLAIGGYQILSVMAQGGMGRVYRARHKTLQRECVLKTLLPELAVSEELVKRFLREIALGAQITHPNVVTFYDASAWEDFCYVVMEYFAGQDLDARFRRKTAPIDTAVSIGEQVASALSAAHEQGIVHRDIKPQNIMMNDKGVVKVLDFGLAKAIQNPEFSQLTMSCGIMGTPGYMPPEQIRNPKSVDHLADIYALGVVLYFCLTGKRPYTGKSAMEILQKTGKDFEKPSTYRRDIPSVLERAILKAMTADPGKRFASAEEMGSVLESIRV